jgi:Polysaccharide lyase
VLRLLAALLLLSGVGAAAEPVVDGFDTEVLGPRWSLGSVTPGRLTVQGDVVRSGAGALRFEVREQDVRMVGGDGEDTERTELREAPAAWARFGETHEYRFSMYAPPDFPIVDRRLVTAQWKQRCDDCSKGRSPIVAQRYRQGVLFVTIETPKGRERIGKYDGAVPGRWLDLRYRIRFGLSDGAVAVWVNGAQVADYRGPLGFPDDRPEVRFGFGLYRDRMKAPMVLYFDEYRKERLSE